MGLGHRRIAYIRGYEGFTADLPRVEGFRKACAEAGIPASDITEVRGDGQFEGGEAATAQLLAAGCDMTAIVCHNDVTAIGAMRAIRSSGRRVPADISVVGCDDIAAASWVVPALTTVAQQKAEMGRLAVERLATALDDPDSAGEVETTRIPMVLRVRESTGPAPDGAGSAMTRTVGVGVIGMGWMGEAHSRAWNAVRDRFFEAGVVPRLVVCADAVEAARPGGTGPLRVRRVDDRLAAP